jgi:hypothetical protein
MVIPSIPSSALSSISNIIERTIMNRITININNTQSRNTLHHGRNILEIGNKSITPLPVTINCGETRSM